MMDVSANVATLSAPMPSSSVVAPAAQQGPKKQHQPAALPPLHLEHLVIDAGAIISGQGFGYFNAAKKFWSVREVIDEIRDSKARHLLSTLPFEIEIRAPSDRAMKGVAEFAKKTGDLAQLSLNDLKILALTYDLELETTGGSNIRAEPKKMLKARQGDNERSQGKPQERASLATTQSSGSNTHKHSIIVTKFEQPEEEVLIEGVECLTVSAKSENLEYAEDQDSEKGKEEGDQSEEDEPSDASGCSDDEDVIEAEEQEGDVDVYSDEKDTEPKQLTADVNDVDEFPSLGGETSVSAAQQVDAAKPAFSWAKIAKDPPTAPKHPVVLPKTNIVIPAGKPTQQRSLLDEYSQGVARTEPADREPSGSRILRSTGASEYTSAASNALRAEEDDGSNWISPSNVKACRVTGAGMLGGPQALGVKSNKVIENTKVACVTTDFSMENVILQMGLHLMSVEGRLIHRIKQWVLRCAACYTIHYETDRLFCSRCGVNMLQRIAASTDARTGELHLHLKKNYTPNTRGLIHSLPKPGSQGRYDGELLLREDQLLTGIWRQKVSKIKHDVKSAFGEDVTKDVGMSINKREFGIKVGLGRRNPNADKGRERRGKKKTKK